MDNIKYNIRYAKREDTELVLGFINRIAEYEQMPDIVKYTKESLEESGCLTEIKAKPSLYLIMEKK